MKVYVAGGIASVPNHKELFQAVEDKLIKAGYDPVNPCKIMPPDHSGKDCPPGYHVGDGGHSSACHLRVDIKALLECDAIYLMSGWQNSTGACFEHRVAYMCGILVLLQDR